MAGSFTTISTYLKQWSEEHSLDEELVEVVNQESVMSDAELFLQKIYTVAKASADEQLLSAGSVNCYDRKKLSTGKIAASRGHGKHATEQAELLEEQQKLSPTKIRARCGPLVGQKTRYPSSLLELERSLADMISWKNGSLSWRASWRGESRRSDPSTGSQQAKSENRSLSQNCLTTEGELEEQSQVIEQTEKLRRPLSGTKHR